MVNIVKTKDEAGQIIINAADNDELVKYLANTLEVPIGVMSKPAVNVNVNSGCETSMLAVSRKLNDISLEALQDLHTQHNIDADLEVLCFALRELIHAEKPKTVILYQFVISSMLLGEDFIPYRSLIFRGAWW